MKLQHCLACKTIEVGIQIDGELQCAKLAVQVPSIVDAEPVVCTSCGTEGELHSGRDRFVCIYNLTNAEPLI